VPRSQRLVRIRQTQLDPARSTTMMLFVTSGR
jgi:hypothetical protein